MPLYGLAQLCELLTGFTLEKAAKELDDFYPFLQNLLQHGLHVYLLQQHGRMDQMGYAYISLYRSSDHAPPMSPPPKPHCELFRIMVNAGHVHIEDVVVELERDPMMAPTMEQAIAFLNRRVMPPYPKAIPAGTRALAIFYDINERAIPLPTLPQLLCTRLSPGELQRRFECTKELRRQTILLKIMPTTTSTRFL